MGRKVDGENTINHTQNFAKLRKKDNKEKSAMEKCVKN